MSEKDDPTDDVTLPFDVLAAPISSGGEVRGITDDMLDAWAEATADVSGPSSTVMLRGQPVHALSPQMLAILKDWGGSTREAFAEREVLGEGGMAVVYLADQNLPPRQVAVKRLRKNTKEQAEQLFAEALLTGSLEHPNIIPVHAIRVDPKLGPEVVLKRVEGVSLTEAYEAERDAEGGLRRLLPKLIQVCNALEYAHARGVFHRDVKTDNIMLGQYGEVYLLDWGIAVNREAKNTNRGTVGTPHYIAPEMLSGDPGLIDARTDVYLLGATLHYLLVGMPRHDAPTALSAAMLALKAEPYDYPDTVFHELGALANRACSFAPRHRHQTVAEFRSGIEDCLTHWDAMRTVRAAQEDYLFVTGPDAEGAPLEETVRRFDAAVLRFQLALTSWSGCTEASTKLESIRVAMTRHYLRAGDAKAARLLMSQVDEDATDERSDLEQLRDAVEQASVMESQVYRSAAAGDLTKSSKGRQRASFAMLAVVAMAVIVTAYNRMDGVGGRTPTDGLIIWLSGTTLFFLALAANRKAILRNEAGRRAMVVLILAPIMVAGVRVVVFVQDLNPVHMHPIETFAIAHVCGTAVEVFPRGPQFAAFALVLGVLGILFPPFAYVAFVTALLSACLGFVWQWLLVPDSETK